MCVIKTYYYSTTNCVRVYHPGMFSCAIKMDDSSRHCTRVISNDGSYAKFLSLAFQQHVNNNKNNNNNGIIMVLTILSTQKCHFALTFSDMTQLNVPVHIKKQEKENNQKKNSPNSVKKGMTYSTVVWIFRILMTYPIYAAASMVFIWGFLHTFALCSVCVTKEKLRCALLSSTFWTKSKLHVAIK